MVSRSVLAAEHLQYKEYTFLLIVLVPKIDNVRSRDGIVGSGKDIFKVEHFTLVIFSCSNLFVTLYNSIFFYYPKYDRYG